MTYRSIRNLHKPILKILEEYEKARNSDTFLTLMLWSLYFPQSFMRIEDCKWVRARDIMEVLPREDAVGRIRRKIQEEGKFLPTDEAVAKARKLNMDEWRIALGYPTVASAGTENPSWTPPSLSDNNQAMDEDRSDEQRDAQDRRDEERMNQHFDWGLSDIAER